MLWSFHKKLKFRLCNKFFLFQESFSLMLFTTSDLSDLGDSDTIFDIHVPKPCLTFSRLQLLIRHLSFTLRRLHIYQIKALIKASCNFENLFGCVSSVLLDLIMYGLTSHVGSFFAASGSERSILNTWNAVFKTIDANSDGLVGVTDLKKTYSYYKHDVNVLIFSVCSSVVLSANEITFFAAVETLHCTHTFVDFLPFNESCTCSVRKTSQT